MNRPKYNLQRKITASMLEPGALDEIGKSTCNGRPAVRPFKCDFVWRRARKTPRLQRITGSDKSFGARDNASCCKFSRWTDEMDLDQLARSLLETSADAILAVDRDSVIRFWNPGAERIFGFSREEALGCSLEMIIPENLRARHYGGFRKTMATGETRYGAGDLLAVPALTRDGRRISIEFSIVMLRDAQGAPSGVAAILRDVTAKFEETRALRKKVAELQASQQAALE